MPYRPAGVAADVLQRHPHGFLERVRHVGRCRHCLEHLHIRCFHLESFLHLLALGDVTGNAINLRKVAIPIVLQVGCPDHVSDNTVFTYLPIFKSGASFLIKNEFSDHILG